MNFSLPDSEGNLRSPGDAPATVLAFTANHCPYALAWHERLIEVAADYEDKGVKFLAIGSNDPAQKPDDGPEFNAARVARGEMGNVPYLTDEDQSVAKSFGATVTPDIFILDEDLNVKYHGAPDADYSDPSQNASYVRDALDSILVGNDPHPAQTEPRGCSIKWK